MNLPLLLERPGRWRAMGIVCITAVILFPSVWLGCGLLFGEAGNHGGEIFRRPFLLATERSLVQLFWVTFWAFAIGWPYGVMFGLNRCLLPRLATLLFALPLFMPTFLWAIGISALRPYCPYRLQSWLDGLSGCVLSLSVLTIPLVVLATSLVVRYLSRSQVESALLAGGTRSLFFLTARHAWPTSFSAALLGALFTASDPGPAQIMGYHGVSSEVLIAIAGRHDLSLAIIKSLGLAGILLPVMVPIAYLCARQMEIELCGREVSHRWEPRSRRPSRLVAALLLALPLLLAAVPIIGLAISLGGGVAAKTMRYAWEVLVESSGATVRYGFLAGTVGLMFGLLLALCAGRHALSRRIVLLFAFLFFSMTPAVHALGMVVLATNGPPWLDFLTRSDWMVGLGLGLRFAPLGALLGVWAFAKIAPSINYIAALHGLPVTIYLTRILLPLMLPTLLASLGAIALLAIADVSTTLLLQVPGSTTLAGRIFAVMDNTSAALVASLCLVYLLGGSAVIAFFLWLGSFFGRPMESHA